MRLAIEAGSHTLDCAVALGITGVPVDGYALVKDGVAATLAPLAERGLIPCQAGAYGFNPLGADVAEQTSALHQIIARAAEAGIRHVPIAPGNHHASQWGMHDARNFTDQALEQLATALAPVAATAERHGVVLTIEPYLKSAISSPERMLALKRRIASPAVQVTLDVSNWYGSPELLDPATASAANRRACATLTGHYSHIHVKEIALSDGFHLHAGLAPLGKGPTDWAEVLTLVAPHVRDDAWVMLEHVASPEEAAASVAHLREAAKRAGVALR